MSASPNTLLVGVVAGVFGRVVAQEITRVRRTSRAQLNGQDVRIRRVCDLHNVLLRESSASRVAVRDPPLFEGSASIASEACSWLGVLPWMLALRASSSSA